MIEDELITIWKSSPHEERIKFEKSRLMIEVQTNIDQFRKSIRNDNIRKISAFIFVIPFLAFSVYKVPFLLSKIASVLLIIFLFYALKRFRVTKKYSPNDFTGTYLEYLKKTRSSLIVLKKQYDTILYWYFLPIFGLMALFISGFIGAPGKSTRVMTSILSMIVVFPGIYFITKRWAKNTIAKKLEKVEELIKVMEE